ncbi:MAG: hypothetical protein RIB63_16970 [Fulvivirga sp.]
MDEYKANLTLQNLIDRGIFEDLNIQFAGVFESKKEAGEYEIEVGVYNLDRVPEGSPYFEMINRFRFKNKTHVTGTSFKKDFPKEPQTINIGDTSRVNGSSSRTEAYRFAFIGAENFNHCTGTLGAFFKQRNSDRTFFISNWHALTNGEVELGSTIIQPRNRDRPLLNDQIGNLYSYYLNDHMDVAIGILNEGITIENQDNMISGFVIPKWGMTLLKQGAGSGNHPKDGTKIISVNCSVRVTHPNYPSGEQIFHHQIMTEDMAAKGDSGSVSVDKSTGQAIGLVCAVNNNKYTVHNPIWMIFKDKKSSFEITEGVNKGATMPELNFEKFV